MPTSLSQEADGQLKNKNIVSTEHSKFKKKKKCSHLCSCNTKLRFSNFKATHKTNKKEGKCCPHLKTWWWLRILRGLFTMSFMGQRSGVNMRSSLWVLEVGATLDQGACCLQSVTSWISSFKNMTAKLEDPNWRLPRVSVQVLFHSISF